MTVTRLAFLAITPLRRLPARRGRARRRAQTPLPRVGILQQYGVDERAIVSVGPKQPFAALATVPDRNHAARRQTARTSRLPVLAGAASAVDRARGRGLAGAGPARYCGGAGGPAFDKNYFLSP